MKKPITLHPSLTPRQKAIIASKSRFLLLDGPAGTAKTYTAIARGLRSLFNEEVEKLVIVRSTVPTRDIGFLPGDQDDKIAPYAQPYVDILDSLSPKFGFRQLVSKRSIEFIPTSFLRGVTFDASFVIVDEFQNFSAHELETAVTRVGENTHFILCGDGSQSDLTGGDRDDHKSVIATLTRMEDFECHAFTVNEIVRSPFVRRYYEAKAGIT